ncbi:hypothetical protein lacNasYZ03_11770 [Lactobacillus nasalidis]|uniref:Peptidase S74 domain-containing protein n=1 Tax=Lactobacillus nasalidis TaxID=2797258 RepID=A0ABQ3W4N7_9LACO|nr:gp58-like family protein [Lactobacillus nasalidis]GHV97901.1 hypothetical protein lacNasYZ01_10830 [Lactobacillus nasalidis]GHW00131.1 hypothetical protein lacNasYZ02_15600 [Lactobacillus nasalidis]GHW01490.1 hypothetical protein lacNasYZ03_11770 [Lactobacillus nasalidis]
MLSQTDAVKQAWAATDRTLDIVVKVGDVEYQATEINTLSYDAAAFTGDTLGIGSTYENSVSIEFASVIEAFKQGLTVLPKIGVLVDGTFQYTPLGTFIISEVDRDRNNNLTTIKALDQMCKLEGSYTSKLTYPASALDIIAEIANQGGVTVNTGELQHLPTLPNITKAITKQTLRTALGWIAQLYAGFATFDRNGQLTIRTTATPDYTISPSEYMQAGLTKNEVTYKTGGIKVTVNSTTTDDNGQEVDNTSTLQAGETTGSQIDLTNDVMTENLLDTIWTDIKDITYYPYTLSWFGNPGIEAGDWVTLTDTQGNSFNVPINGYTMSFNGGLESTISANQSSSNAGGYSYSGSANSITNVVKALQVRHTATGNNVYPPSFSGTPSNPKKGDVWYKQNGNNVECWIYEENDGQFSWIKTPLDGEVKAQIAALDKKTDSELTKTKSEISSTAESQWNSATTATSEVDSRLESLRTQNSQSVAELRSIDTSLHNRASQMESDVNDSLASVKNSLTAVDASMRTATSEEMASVKSSLSAVQSQNNVTQNSLANKAGSLATATSELQSKTGKLSGSLSTADSMIMFNSSAIAEVKKTAGEISTTVSNIRVGGRNLIINSDFRNEQTNWVADAGSLSVESSTEYGHYLKYTPNSVGNMRVYSPVKKVWKAGTTYSYSFYAKADSTVQVKASRSLTDYGPTHTLTTEWQRFTGQIKSTATADDGTLSLQVTGAVAACFARVKLETGTMATDWTPAPEDTDQAISTVSQTADAIKADLSTTKGDVASIKATATSLQTQISNNKSDISTVKQTADSLQTGLSNAKGDISTLKQTADSLTTRMSTAEGNVSSLKQTASGLQTSVSDNAKNISAVKQTATDLQTTVGKLPEQWQKDINDKANAQPLTSNVDMNNLTTAGTYLIQDFSAKNAPISAWFMATVTATSDKSRVIQRIRKDSYNVAYERSNYNSGWTTWERVATGTDVSSIKQTMDSITTRVTNAEGNISNVKQTATDLQTSLTNAKGDISTLKQTASGLESSVADNKKNISSVQQTATDLTSKMSDAQGNISALQQKADSLTSTISTGGRNLLSNTREINDSSIWSNLALWDKGDFYHDGGNDCQIVQTSTQQWNGLKQYVFVEAGRKYTFSIDAKSGDNSNHTAGFYITLNSAQEGSYNRADAIGDNQIFTYTPTWTRYSFTITATTNGYVAPRIERTTTTSELLQLARPQFEYGDTATPWKPSNGDISSLQQTASSLTADMKDAKGNISSLQATSKGLTTRVSNAEGNVSSLQETAKELKATVGDANSGLVSTVNAIPGQITSAITASKQATVITSATDVHNMKTAGYYLLKGTLTNSPVDAWAFLRVITSDDGQRIYHRIWKDNASTVYTEEYTGSWSGWATHINSDNLKSNVITAINQSTEGVRITGTKILLDGDVKVTDGYTLTADHIKAGTMSADRISGGTLNFSDITAIGINANSITSGRISGTNLDINLDDGTVAFTKGKLYSTDGGFNISIDGKSFYLDMGNNTKLWIDGNGYHLQESASQHLWMNKDGLHNYTDSNSNGLWINDTTLKVLNSNNAGLVAKDGMLQFSTTPIWNSDNVYSGTLNSQLYGTIGFNSNLLSSSLNGIFIKGREGVVIGTSDYSGGSLFGAGTGYTDVGQAGSGINLPNALDKPASIFTKAPLVMLGGPTYTDSSAAKWTKKPKLVIGGNTAYSHNGASMYQTGVNERGNQLYAEARNVSIWANDWINLDTLGRVAIQAQYFHSYPTYLQTTSAGANVYVANDGALVRSSSARKYKTDIQDADNHYGDKLIEFAPQKWIDKAEKKRYEEDPENNKKPGYYYGLIADDLDAAGLDMLVNYGADGQVEGINYDRIGVALLPVVKALKEEVQALKKQLKALK